MNQAPAAALAALPLHQYVFHEAPGSLAYMMPRARIPGLNGAADVWIVALEALSMSHGATLTDTPELWTTPHPMEARRRCTYRHHDETWDSGIIASFSLNLHHPAFALYHHYFHAATGSYVFRHAVDVFRYSIGPNGTIIVYPEPGEQSSSFQNLNPCRYINI